MDFNELNPVAPLQLLLETLNSRKTLPAETMPTILSNVAAYLCCLPLENASGPSIPMWSTVLQQLELIYRKLLFMLNIIDDVTPLLSIMASVFKLPLIAQFKVSIFVGVILMVKFSLVNFVPLTSFGCVVTV